MSDNIQTKTTGRLTPCLQKKIDRTTYLIEVHFSTTSTSFLFWRPGVGRAHKKAVGMLYFGAKK